MDAATNAQFAAQFDADDGTGRGSLNDNNTAFFGALVERIDHLDHESIVRIEENF